MYLGNEESTYEDNMLSRAFTGTDSPPTPPEMKRFDGVVYYPTMEERFVEKYKKIQVLKTKPEWIEIPFYPAEDNAQIKVRLVPTPTEERRLSSE